MNGMLLVATLTLLQTQPSLPAGGKSTILVPSLVSAPKSFLTAAKGYRVDLFAEGLNQPRMLAIAPNGDIFVVLTRLERKVKVHPHEVVVLSEFAADGRPTKRTTWSTDLNLPFGIQFGFGHLYVGNTDSVVRWKYEPGQVSAVGKPEIVIRGIPSNGYRNHWTRNILFDGSMKSLFLTIGSEKNLAEEGPRRAVIERYPLTPSGEVSGKPITYASGLRNPIGLALNPENGALWANVAERDYQGDNLVPDFLTSIRPDGFYGWPYAYIGKNRDRRMPHRPAMVAKSIVPDVLFQAHSTPIDVKFYGGGAVVALHGSQNRSRLNGYKVVLVPFGKDGRPSGKPQDFVTGWLPPGSNKQIFGRPAGLAVQKDGSLLIVDDWAGRIWRVRPAAGVREKAD